MQGRTSEEVVLLRERTAEQALCTLERFRCCWSNCICSQL